MTREMLNIEDLSCDSVDTKPVDMDWSTRLDENMEGYRHAEAMDCPKCGESLVMWGPCGYIECPECGTAVEEEDVAAEGPMMNYYYPVQIDDVEEAARLVEDWPVCVVEFDDGETGLALTGGGMDLSWEICGAFIALGYLPPVHFCRLPDLAGWEKDEWRVPILKAALESCKVAERWAASKRQQVEEMLTKATRDAA
jgi:endogenous inhibitor of DNA gyrase (YacG/DUF329 family)